MPNRILREGINSSMRVNQLSMGAEIFYRRLMSVVDDWGRTEAVPELLLARLFPLKVQSIDLEELKSWADECIREDLIVLYIADKKLFVEITNFNQQRRAKESKWPKLDPKMLCTCYADAQQQISVDTRPLSNAHLGVCGGACEDVCEGGGAIAPTESAAPASKAPDSQTSRNAPPAEQILESFNRTFGLNCRLTAARSRQLKARWRDDHWQNNWEAALARAGPSAFLRGSNDRGWRIDLEFFLRPDTVTTILEGKYDNRPSANAANHAEARREQANADVFNRFRAAAAAQLAEGFDDTAADTGAPLLDEAAGDADRPPD